jgi:hypothetical protein
MQPESFFQLIAARNEKNGQNISSLRIRLDAGFARQSRSSVYRAHGQTRASTGEGSLK